MLEGFCIRPNLLVINIFNRYWLTNWNWTIALIYFATASAYSYTGKLKNTSEILLSMLHPLMWIVSLVFWMILAVNRLDSTQNSTFVGKFDWIIGHSMNFIPPMIDLFLSKTAVPKKYVVFAPALSMLYCIMLIIVRLATNIDWPYSFLGTFNCERPCPKHVNYLVMLGVVIPLIMIACALFFLIFKGIIRIRDRRRANGNDSAHHLLKLSQNMRKKSIDTEKSSKTNKAEMAKRNVAPLDNSEEKVPSDKKGDVAETHQIIGTDNLDTKSGQKTDFNSSTSEKCDAIVLEVPGFILLPSLPKPAENHKDQLSNAKSIEILVESTKTSEEFSIGVSEDISSSIPLVLDGETLKSSYSANLEHAQLELSNLKQNPSVKSPETTGNLQVPEMKFQSQIKMEFSGPSEPNQLTKIIQKAATESFKSGSSHDIGIN